MVDIARSVHLATQAIADGSCSFARAHWSDARRIARIVVDTESELIDDEIAGAFARLNSSAPVASPPAPCGPPGWERDVLACDCPEEFRNIVQRARWKLSKLSPNLFEAPPPPSVDACRFLFPARAPKKEKAPVRPRRRSRPPSASRSPLSKKRMSEKLMLAQNVRIAVGSVPVAAH